MACTENYQLIILDNILPKKSGKMVCQTIRGLGQTTPILMLSVESDSETKTQFLNLGADDYLTKPFSYQELLARIRALLRRPPLIKSHISQLGRLYLDSQKQFFSQDGQEIHLTKKEFSIMDCLMKNQGRILSRGALIEQIWDMNYDLLSNTLEAHITKLRKKLGETDLIQNVPGRGYRLIERKGR